MVIPAGIAIPALLCYYQGGPRHNQPTEAPPEEETPIKAQEETMHKDVLPPAWKPRGYAAARMKVENNENNSGSELTEKQ